MTNAASLGSNHVMFCVADQLIKAHKVTSLCHVPWLPGHWDVFHCGAMSCPPPLHNTLKADARPEWGREDVDDSLSLHFLHKLFQRNNVLSLHKLITNSLTLKQLDVNLFTVLQDQQEKKAWKIPRLKHVLLKQ